MYDSEFDKVVVRLTRDHRIGECLDLLRNYHLPTFEHCMRVAYHCWQENSAYLSSEDLDTLVLAAMLHDLGKVKLPLEILNKQSTDNLTNDQWTAVKRHPVDGYNLLLEHRISEIDPRACLVVRDHHQYQPNSYPEKEPRASDLGYLTIRLHGADAVDALRNRPYNSHLPEASISEIISEISDLVGNMPPPTTSPSYYASEVL